MFHLLCLPCEGNCIHTHFLIIKVQHLTLVRHKTWIFLRKGYLLVSSRYRPAWIFHKSGRRTHFLIFVLSEYNVFFLEIIHSLSPSHQFILFIKRRLPIAMNLSFVSKNAVGVHTDQSGSSQSIINHMINSVLLAILRVFRYSGHSAIDDCEHSFLRTGHLPTLRDQASRLLWSIHTSNNDSIRASSHSAETVDV